MIYDFNFKILICLIILSLILVVLCKKIFNKNFKETNALLLICFYFILIIYKTQFPIFINNDVMETELGGIKLGRDVNLIPFKDFAHMTSLLNIVMFIPIGFLQGFVVKNNWKKNIIVGFILCHSSFSIIRLVYTILCLFDKTDFGIIANKFTAAVQ